MRFTFSRRFYLLLALGLVPLSLSWGIELLRYGVLAFDLLLIAAAIIDYYTSRKLPEGLSVTRQLERRFAIGDRNRISVLVDNWTTQTFRLRIKDEYPPEMTLDESREAEFAVGPQQTAEFYYHLTPTRRGHYEF